MLLVRVFQVNKQHENVIKNRSSIENQSKVK